MRGQIASIDIVFSTILLGILAFTIISFANTELKASGSFSLDEKRDGLTLLAAQQLALTAGRPENWNASNCERLGLSCGEGELCAEKISGISSLYSSDYNLTRKHIGLGAYDVSILVCSPNNYSSCDYNLSTQARETDRLNSSHVSRAEVLSTLGGKTVSVIIYAWE